MENQFPGGASFVVMGDPVGKGRTKHRNIVLPNGRIINQEYTPAKTRNYEEAVRQEYMAQVGRKQYPRQYALALEVMIFKSIPKRTPKKRRALMLSGQLLPGKVPDVDNVLKAVNDGLNKVAYEDDSQIVHIGADAFYSENPRVEVQIWVKGING